MQLKYKEMFHADVAFLHDCTPKYGLNKRCVLCSETVSYITSGPTLNGASVAGASQVRASIVLLLLTVKEKVNVPEGPVGEWNRGIAPLTLVNARPQLTFSRIKRPCTDCRDSTVDPTPILDGHGEDTIACPHRGSNSGLSSPCRVVITLHYPHPHYGR